MTKRRTDRIPTPGGRIFAAILGVMFLGIVVSLPVLAAPVTPRLVLGMVLLSLLAVDFLIGAYRNRQPILARLLPLR